MQVKHSRLTGTAIAMSTSKRKHAARHGLPPDPRTNELLASISAAAFNRIAPDLEPEYLWPGETIFHQTLSVKFLYFPVTAIISLFNEPAAGTPLEIGLV